MTSQANNFPENTMPYRVAGRRPTLMGLLFFMLLGLAPAWAGTLNKADIQRRFGVPFEVQDKLTDIPAWPVTSSLEKEVGPVAYVFESIDIAPLPGFEGSPMNFLISIDRKGNFLDVEVLQQREPVFTFRDLGGLGDTPLREFIAQYAGKSLNQPFVIALDAARNHSGLNRQHVGHATLDGIAKATTSVRIVNRTVLTSALAIARAKLGFAEPTKRGPAAQARPEVFERLSFAQLLDKGMIGRLRLSNAEIERRFAGTEGAGVDEEALAHPDDPYVDLYVAYLNAPTIGRSLLGDAQYETLMARNFENRHLWWIGSAGRFRIIDDDFTPGTQSPYVALAQDGGFVDLRDQGFEPTGIAGPPALNASRIFGVVLDAGVDPARSLDIVLTVTRAKGMVLPTLTHQKIKLAYQPPDRLFSHPSEPLPEWLLAWKGRWLDIVVIVLALALLGLVLARPRWISVNPRRLRLFRLGFLAWTLGYLGWYAQGQLSIVQITGAFKSLNAGLGLSSYLYDPVSLVLFAFTLISFVAWGRGTFCGWLCPFGALQEFIGKLARLLRLPQIKIPLAVAKKLEWGRYLVLALLVGAAFLLPRAGETLNEVEPFKTAITVGFDRTWPFVAYAVGLLVAGAFYYKFFCRFICPLGGAMSLGGRLRRWNWLPRRAECGKPCQRCKVVCEYDAIEPSGEIRYDACFQCLDCVGIYHDDRRCVPIMIYDKRGKTLTPRAAGKSGGTPAEQAA
jgi:transcriptional regulator of nitric oxide reductase